MKNKKLFCYVVSFIVVLFLYSCQENTDAITDNNTLSFEVDGIKFNMKYVENGSFIMGEDKKDITYEDTCYTYNGIFVDINLFDTPKHEVVLTKDYWIGETEVTQGLYKSVMEGNKNGFSATPSFYSINGCGTHDDDYNRPVEGVSWISMIVFCNRLSTKLGMDPVYSIDGRYNPDDWGDLTSNKPRVFYNYNIKGFRLPTEAEWEYAARGGNKTSYKTYSGSNNVFEVCNYWSKTTYPTASKKPNELGIYDMTGNVGELCFDSGGQKYSEELSIDPIYNIYRHNEHVIRGRVDSLPCCHITSRGIYYDSNEYDFEHGTRRSARVGARIALTK